jgi:ERCC4-type nuclease
LTIWVTKPRGDLAERLSQAGCRIEVLDDEGNIDRYVLGPQLAVERRTPASFLQGIQDKSLFTSAISLREHFEIGILIVEGAIDFDRTGFHPQAVRGALSAMMLEYGISVLVTPNPEETTALLLMMARHAQVGIPEISLVPKRKAVDLPDLQRRVVEMLPGCGRVAARELLQHFGSVSRIVQATESELQQVRGIGEKRAAEIARVLHAAYASIDTERDLEEAAEANPHLLFDAQMTLLARQHVIATTDGERHVVDLVYLDGENAQLILVELKRDALTAEHEAQLRRYFEVADQSPLLSQHLTKGYGLRGILATISDCTYVPDYPNINVVIVDKGAAIAQLAALRRLRLGAD